MSVTLSRQSGSATYTTQELAALITSLEASNNQHTVASGVAFYRISALRMLILDVDALHNRKLVETYAIHHDSTQPFELKFTSSNIDFALEKPIRNRYFDKTCCLLLGPLLAPFWPPKTYPKPLQNRPRA